MLFGVNMPRIEWAYWSSFYGGGSGQVTHTLATMATSPIFMVMDRKNTSVTKVLAHLVMTYLEKEIKQELVALRWKRSDLIMKVLIKAINPAFPPFRGAASPPETGKLVGTGFLNQGEGNSPAILPQPLVPKLKLVQDWVFRFQAQVFFSWKYQISEKLKVTALKSKC